MARLILKSPYLKPGGKKSPGGYLKYIATREGVEMAEDTSRHLPATADQQKQIKALIKKHPQSKESHAYEDYLSNPTRGNADAFLWNICEEYQDGPKRDVYLRYIDERPGSNGLFTDEGVPIVLSQVQKEMNEHPGNIWTHIISLRREDAERLGFNTTDDWMHLLRSQRNMIAQQMKIAPENFRWYAAFHNAGHHPHVHMMAYSIKPTEPYLTEKGISTIKSNLAQEIFRQDLLQIYQKQTDLRDELRKESRDRITEIVDAINHGSFDNPQMQTMLVQLADKLAKAKGKKQYGYLNADTKKLVDAVVENWPGTEESGNCTLCGTNRRKMCFAPTPTKCLSGLHWNRKRNSAPFAMLWCRRHCNCSYPKKNCPCQTQFRPVWTLLTTARLCIQKLWKTCVSRRWSQIPKSSNFCMKLLSVAV